MPASPMKYVRPLMVSQPELVTNELYPALKNNPPTKIPTTTTSSIRLLMNKGLRVLCLTFLLMMTAKVEKKDREKFLALRDLPSLIELRALSPSMIIF